MNYNTDQWLIFNYAGGAGGKFLTTCFWQFDKLAHWAEQPMSHADTLQWYADTMPQGSEWWPAKEIDTPWVLPGISKAWPRGEATTAEEFNSIAPTIKNTYFHDSWKQGLLIPDFWHKTKRPLWWSDANWITIHIDDQSLYRRLMFSKLFEFKDNRVIDIWQRPDVGTPEERARKQQFKNTWYWDNISSIDEFFDQYVIDFPWYSCWDFNQPPTGNYITLTELFDVDKLVEFMLKYEDQMEQTVSKEYTQRLHQIWLDATVEKMNAL